MKPTLYILCGVPGSGKSTWAYKFINDQYKDIKYVSRDSIRFHMLKDGEGYFSHEKEVFKEFVENIVQNLNNGNDVIADATHLNRASRAKLLRAITMNSVDFDTICVCLMVPKSVCLRQNAQRSGRARVPDEDLVEMYHRFEKPTLYEHETIKEVWTIAKKG